MRMPAAKFHHFVNQRKDFVTVNDLDTYVRARVQLHWRGIVLRDRVEGGMIKTKRQQVARAGDLLVAEIDAKVGGIGIVPPELDGAIVSSHYFLFEIDQARCLRGWLEYYIRSGALGDQIAARGSTNYAAIRPQHVLDFEIPLPPLAEQRRIVARLDQLSTKIEEALTLRRSAAEHAETFIAATRAKLFEQSLRGETIALEQAATLERGKFSHRPRNDPQFFGGKHPWIQIGEIEASNKYVRHWAQTLNDQGLEFSRKFPRGTVLVSIAATIGAVGILDFDCCIPDSIVAVTPNSGVDSEYIYHYLGYVRSHLEQIAPQSAQKNVNLRILSVLPIPRLALGQQRRIVDYIDGLQAKVDNLKKLQEETSKELDALMPSILSKAFSGEL